MTGIWHLQTPRRDHLVDASAVASLLQAAERPELGREMLSFVNRLATVDFISIVDYNDACGPEQVEGHAVRAGLASVTAECFVIYRQHHFRSDQATQIADHLRRGNAPATVTASHLLAEELPSPSWRQQIYDRQQLAARFSFIYAPSHRAPYAVNLYRHRSNGPFGDRDVERLLGIGPLLRQVHRMALQAAHRPCGTGSAERLAAARQALALWAAALSPREREVCAQIACGVSADGMAEAMGVAPSTVSTLRRRAYVKLAQQGVTGGRLGLVRWLGSATITDGQTR